MCYTLAIRDSGVKMSKFLRPYKVLRSFAIPVLLLLLVGILLSRGTADIITDPDWNELYLQQGRRLFLIKKELGKNLYLPSTNFVPTDTDVEALRDRISSSRASLFLLSPLLSRPFLSTGLWEDFPDRDFIVISFGESVPSLAAKNLIVLSAGGEGLVQKVFELLKVLGDDRNSTGKILVLRDNSSWVDQDTIELLREKIESELPEADVRF